jgi:hypothetical protein
MWKRPLLTQRNKTTSSILIPYYVSLPAPCGPCFVRGDHPHRVFLLCCCARLRGANLPYSIRSSFWLAWICYHRRFQYEPSLGTRQSSIRNAEELAQRPWLSLSLAHSSSLALAFWQWRRPPCLSPPAPGRCQWSCHEPAQSLFHLGLVTPPTHSCTCSDNSEGSCTPGVVAPFPSCIHGWSPHILTVSHSHHSLLLTEHRGDYPYCSYGP